ncbi:hypothetical protein Purlil1_13778 [Purpureocillium lilacinum]|uniref:Uncharacterized protein n=1 Tax=Purpureocillium lilacinum TaxID=33203 RepID=A0ABR0BD50_PURLI|nr:hypothetical protein Purlil1_13778 [Purpureocillium lilacinum]
MPSFDELAGRLRVVETQTGSSPSAPLTKSQWCNLAWRINYCHNRAEASRTMKASNSAVIWQLEGCTLSDAEDCFNTSFRFDRYQVLQHDDVSRYSSLLQRVCFMAGEKGVKLDQIPATVWDIMALTDRDKNPTGEAATLYLHTSGSHYVVGTVQPRLFYLVSLVPRQDSTHDEHTTPSHVSDGAAAREPRAKWCEGSSRSIPGQGVTMKSFEKALWADLGSCFILAGQISM